MKLLLQQQQQQQQQLSGNTRNADAANVLSQQSLLMQQQTNFAAAMNNNMMSTTGSAGEGFFTQNDRITPQLQHQQQQHQQQQQQQQFSHMTSSSTAAAANSNNLFAGIDPTQMMHLPQSSQNMILQRQYQAMADRIAEEHNKARAIQIAGQRVNGTGSDANANSASSPSGGTAHQFLQSLQKDMGVEEEADASDPLMASLQMYSQYGEDANPLAANTMGGQLQTTNSNSMYDGNDFGPPSNSNEGGVDDKLQQLQIIQAQLAQLQRMEIEMKQQAEAQEKQHQQQRQLQLQQEQLQQQQRQQQQSASTSTQHAAGHLTPPTSHGDGESSGATAAPPLSPPSLPVDAALSDVAAQGMRAKVLQYEEAARSMLIQEGKQRRSKMPQHQHQRRRSSVVSNSSSSTGDETGRKRRAPDQSWRDVMKDDADVQECRAKMRRRV